MEIMKTLTVGGTTFDIVDDGAVRFTEQTLTDEQKARARENIGIGAGSNIEPEDDDIPKVFISGTIPTTKTDALAEMEYISQTDRFKAYLKIKCQGSSSMSYPKKNFTIKMYADEAREAKKEMVFKDWEHKTNKYVLKANWVDHSHARNIVGARLWGETISSRVDFLSLPEELRNSPNNGAVDGFPIKLYANGVYQGLYTWNIGKDDWMFGMNEDNADHVVLCAETNTNGIFAETPCNFRALWDGVHENHWSVEVGTNSEAVKNSLNALISCVKNTDDDTFKATIGNYLDVQSAIDYYLHQYVICGLDGLAKNMLLATYNGTKWICGAYDMDSTFGLWWDGTRFVSAEYRCPEDYQERYSLLWERIAILYSEEIKNRYIELRNTVYSYANMVTKFERFVDTIGKDLYAEDLEVYTGIPSGDTNNIKQIRNYIRDRLIYCDSCLNVPTLDEGYTIVSYIESSGTQFIDTGVSGGTNASYEIKFSTCGTGVDWSRYFGGANKDTSVPEIYVQPSSNVCARFPHKGSYWYNFGWKVSDTEAHTIQHFADGQMYKDGVPQNLGTSLEEFAGIGWGSATWYVFAQHTVSASPATMRLYYLKMYTDGELVRDFVPVRRDVDGVYGLYDLVTKEFFGNIGTGEFSGSFGGE